MNKKKITSILLVTIFLLTILQITNAQINDYNNYENLEIELYINAGFNLIGEESAEVAEAKATLTFIPQNDLLQSIDLMQTYSKPNAEVAKGPEEINFIWENPTEEKFSFGLNSKITTYNKLFTIDKKIQFPLEETIDQYTKPTQFIDITPSIREKAEELAEGEDDLYIVAFKAGYWIQQNIEYNLTTLTADVVQKSSWVIDRREGVCDEITNLFISMMRSLGIPSRFVYGMVYTNIGYKWSPHAWAEVYFPDKGWVPFDVTLGQFGWIDPSHIKLKTSADSGEPAIKYAWRSNGKNLEGKKIDLGTKIISQNNKISSPLDFKVKTLADNVSPGSFVPIEIEIKNNNDFYLSNQFTVVKGINLTEKNFKSILLKPGETKKLFWIGKTPEDAEAGYLYISTIEVEDQFHTKTAINISYTNEGDKISLREAKELIEESYQEKELRVISNKLSLRCNSPGVLLLNNEEIKIECKINNKGTTRLENIRICAQNECQETSLSIAEEQTIQVPIKNVLIGSQSVLIEASNSDVKVSDLVIIEGLDNPGVKIVNVNYPDTIKYKEGLNITILLTTRIPTKDIKMKINDREITEMDKLDSSQEIIVATKAKNFVGNKDFRVGIEFKDMKDQIYHVESSYPINIIEIPWYIELMDFLGFI